MTLQQLQTLEAELQRRGYRKWTRGLTDNESWAWFKSFAKGKDEAGEVISGYQVAFRVWDNTENCRRFNLDKESAYGFDFWTSALGADSRMDFTSNWEPICDFDTFEAMAADFNGLVSKHDNNKNN